MHLPVSYSSSSPMLKTGFTPLYGFPTRSLLLTCLKKKKKKRHQRYLQETLEE